MNQVCTNFELNYSPFFFIHAYNYYVKKPVHNNDTSHNVILASLPKDAGNEIK